MIVILVSLGCVICPLMIGWGSAKMEIGTGLQLLGLTILVFPGAVLAFSHSKWYVPYALMIWAITPEVRRVMDWSVDTYHPMSYISIAPLLVMCYGSLILIKEWRKLQRHVQHVFMLLVVVLVYGVALGLSAPFPALFALLNYAAPLLLLPYMHITKPNASEKRLWIQLYGLLAIGVSIYGIMQYIYAPAWDVFWMEHADMGSIGKPEPFEIRVFSTLNSPGPAASFLTGALFPMLVERKWRPLGWAGVLIVLAGLGLTLVRSSWLALIVMILVYACLSPLRKKVRLLSALFVIIMLMMIGAPLLPGSEGVTERVATLGDIESDHSYMERMDFARELVPLIKHDPLGRGLGTTGTGTKLANGGELGEFGVFDNGWGALLLTFGVPGTLVWTGCLLFLLWKSMQIRTGVEPTRTPYAMMSAAMIAAAIVTLMFENSLTGLTALYTWFYIGLGEHT
ncbi:O-antigen ligase family protein [Marinicrinis sediminis]|uniref:O-antigen ligase family protein n=2 Tax=Marinicrinis sediminis TaxID=1652465 RepID=A0ABW5RCN7_9BACL